jgi:hypothetical protein
VKQFWKNKKPNRVHIQCATAEYLQTDERQKEIKLPAAGKLVNIQYIYILEENISCKLITAKDGAAASTLQHQQQQANVTYIHTKLQTQTR